MVFAFVSCDDSAKAPEEIYTEVGTEEALIEAISNGQNIKLTADIVLSKTAIITDDIKFDLNGKTITADGTALSSQGEKAKLTINGDGKVISNKNIAIAAGSFDSKTKEYINGNIEINDGDFISKEYTIGVFGNSNAIINGGTFTAKDNAVIGTNGSKPLDEANYNITINGGTFNGNITTNGYIACGIYMANAGKVTLNGGTFNINGGIGVLVRSGELIANNVEISLKDKTGLDSGWVGDQKLEINVGSEFVVDKLSKYPGGEPSITNNTDYTPVILSESENV